MRNGSVILFALTTKFTPCVSQVNINGTNRCEGSHVSVFLYCMKERCDGRQLEPLVGNFIITLLNQKMDNNHYSLSFTEMTPGFIPSIVSPVDQTTLHVQVLVAMILFHMKTLRKQLLLVNTLKMTVYLLKQRLLQPLGILKQSQALLNINSLAIAMYT